MEGELKPYYQDDAVTIYHGSAFDYVARLECNVMVTDPPYGVNLGNHSGSKEKRSGYIVKSGYDIYNDTPANFVNDVVPIVNGYIKKCVRSAVFGCVPNVWHFDAPDALGGIYLPAGSGRTKWGFQNMAPVLLYGVAPELHKGAKNTMLRIPIRKKSGIDHPCPKPIEWLLWLVGLCTAKGDVVIDPFLGSGTTLLACKRLGVRGIGFEISEKYCEIAAKRMMQGVFDFAA